MSSSFSSASKLPVLNASTRASILFSAKSGIDIPSSFLATFWRLRLQNLLMSQRPRRDAPAEPTAAANLSGSGLLHPDLLVQRLAILGRNRFLLFLLQLDRFVRTDRDTVATADTAVQVHGRHAIFHERCAELTAIDASLTPGAEFSVDFSVEVGGVEVRGAGCYLESSKNSTAVTTATADEIRLLRVPRLKDQSRFLYIF